LSFARSDDCDPETLDKNFAADEQFVMMALGKHFSATWIPGEDPPDAYLQLKNNKVGVEVSTLVQHVEDNEGSLVSRLSDDMTALSLCDELDKELRHLIPKNRRVRLVLEAPITKKRQLKPILFEKILQAVNSPSIQQGSFDYEILENKIAFQVTDYTGASTKKVLALVTNSRIGANISENARIILNDRIASKSKKCESLKSEGPLWLVLLNRYWLADIECYKRALEMSDIPHPFDQIILVSDDEQISMLFSGPNEPSTGADLTPVLKR
jgi:hypothetical protein